MKKNHKICIHEDSSRCILFSACDDCYYYKEYQTCPYCGRKVPNNTWFRGKGCLWCQK